MTNLLATVVVVIVTNITTASNESGCKICSNSGPGFTFAVYHAGGFTPCAPYREATEKTETTEIVEVKTLRFTWEGEEYATKRERVLERKVKKWTRKEAWEETP